MAGRPRQQTPARRRRPHAAAVLGAGTADRGRRDEAGAGRAAADSERPPTSWRACRQAEAAEGLQHRGLCRRRAERALAAPGRQGHGVRRQPPAGQGACARRQGRQARGQGDRLGPASSERARLQGRHALHRRAVEDLQDREDRGQSRQSAEADGDLRRPAEGRAARLEVHRHRAGQQALRSDRPALQQLPGRPTRMRRSAASISTAAARRSIARGVRNTVGFDWHPVSKELYFTDNGRDWVSEDSSRGRAQSHHQGR